MSTLIRRASLVLLLISAPTLAAEKTSIVFLLAIDLGWKHVAYHGSTT